MDTTINLKRRRDSDVITGEGEKKAKSHQSQSQAETQTKLQRQIKMQCPAQLIPPLQPRKYKPTNWHPRFPNITCSLTHLNPQANFTVPFGGQRLFATSIMTRNNKRSSKINL